LTSKKGGCILAERTGSKKDEKSKLKSQSWGGGTKIPLYESGTNVKIENENK
jgi:hypothetical protein